MTRPAESPTGDHVAAYRFATLDAAELRDVEAIVAGGLDAMLTVTRSPVGFVALADESGDLRLTAKSADQTRNITRETMQSLARSVMQGDSTGAGGATFMGVPLHIGHRLIGMIGVANAPDRKSTRLNSSHLVISY